MKKVILATTTALAVVLSIAVHAQSPSNPSIMESAEKIIAQRVNDEAQASRQIDKAIDCSKEEPTVDVATALKNLGCRMFTFYNDNVELSMDAAAGVDQDKKKVINRAILLGSVKAGRVKLKTRLNTVVIVALDTIREELKHNPGVIAGVSAAIEAGVRAQYADALKIPATSVPNTLVAPKVAALLESKVNAFVETQTGPEARRNALIRMLAIEVNADGVLGDDWHLTIEGGKVDPLYQTDSDYRTNPTQAQFHFGLSRPALRLVAEQKDEKGFIVSLEVAYDPGFGAIEDKSGFDTIGYLAELMSRKNTDFFNVSGLPNAFEVGIGKKMGEAGKLIVFLGQRPEDANTSNKSNYLVLTHDVKVGAYTIRSSGSFERLHDEELIQRQSISVARAVLGERLNVGAYVYNRRGGHESPFTTVLVGANGKIFEKGRFILGAGARVGYVFVPGTGWKRNAEVAGGMTVNLGGKNTRKGN